MDTNQYLKRIDSLTQELRGLQPMKPEDEQRLSNKFRLEWDYNSNHLEGNTLTYGHTKLLLFFDQIPADYTGREIDEMRNHDVAIRMVVDFAKDRERKLNEAFIRELNQVILVKPFYKEAITPDGQGTKKLVEPGGYKKTPNSVRLENGEIFQYSSPEETPAKMQELLKFYDVHSASTETHPVWLAAMMHYQFVRIHPFDDGNGRVARLIMNYVLIRNGLPPVIVKSEDKRGYLAALNKADVGDLESLVNYVCDQLIWSLELSIKAAKGDAIDEESDLDKEILVLKKQLGAKDLYSKSKDTESINRTINESIFPLLEFLENKLAKLDELFVRRTRESQMMVGGRGISIGSETIGLEELKRNITNNLNSVNDQHLSELSFSYGLRGYKKSSRSQYMSISLKFNFNEFNFTVQINNGHNDDDFFTYDSGIAKTKMENIIRRAVEHVMNQIRSASGLK